MSTAKQMVQAAPSSAGLFGRLARVVRYRELLFNLIRRELRARYKESVLGFLWSMLTPVLYLVVFYVVFTIFLPTGIPAFPVFLLSGLLPWTLFASSLAGGAGSIVSNGALLKKVYFPREVLPLASIGGALFHFFLQMLVLLGFMLVFRYPFTNEYLVLVPLALLVEIVLLAGLCLLLSGLTVYLRDIQHFLELALLAWFWMTPIVYQVGLVFDKLTPRGLFGLYLLNPMTTIVMSFQRAFYNQTAPRVNGNVTHILLDRPIGWYLQHLGWVAAAGLALVVVGQFVFARIEANFAEEL
ncbi:MAG: ABC transporter permease [Actinomycetota bacterium]